MTAPPAPDGTDLGAHYARSRERLAAVITEAGQGAGEVPVPACPGWTVHDVVAHLVGNIEDGAAGRIQGVPTTEQTAAQVDRHRGEPTTALLGLWEEGSPLMEAFLQDGGARPALYDALTHEHDVRGALDRPGARDVDTVRLVATDLVTSLAVPLEVTLPDGSTIASDAPGEPHRLRTSAFEVLRLRLGRRSREQITALDWDRDPTPALDRLTVFPPPLHPLDEPDRPR